MTRTAKLHWSEGRRPGDVLWVTLCGQLVVECATLPDEVTCKKCAKKLKSMQLDTSAEEYVLAVSRGAIREFIPPQPLLDPASDLPIVSPFTWPTIKSRHHWCAHCAVCSWFNEIEADHNASPWKKRHRLSSERHRWPSVNAALEWYVGIRAEGYTVATLGEALAKIGKLGTVIRSNGGTQRAQEEADDAHAIDQALSRCFVEPNKRGLTRQERLYILLETASGRKPHLVAASLREYNSKVAGLTGPMVAAVAADGRWTCYETLRACKMVPRR